MKPDFKKTAPRRAPFCQCLHEIENKLPRTKFCFMACSEQLEILAARKKQNKKSQ